MGDYDHVVQAIEISYGFISFKECNECHQPFPNT